MDSNNHVENNSNNENQQLEPIVTNIRGTVKWFHRIKGYGFITRDDNKDDIFVHYSGLKQEDHPMNKRKSKKRLNLMDNERVVFDIVQAKDQLEARNVTGRNGSLIIDLIAFKRGIQPFNLEIINEHRESGKVKWFNVKLRYGYVQCDRDGKDVYVHANAIINNNPNKYKPSLHDGETVEFDLMQRRDGKVEAVNVTGPNGTQVQGSEYSPDKTDKTKQPYTETGLSGTVKWFNLKSGFGYITRNDNSSDVYVHYSSIKSKNPNHRLRSLADGEAVLFNIIDGTKGPEAVDVTGPNGNPVMGSNYVRATGQRRAPRAPGGDQRGPGRRPPRGDQNNNDSRMRGMRRMPRNRMSGPPPPQMQNREPQQNRGRGPRPRSQPRADNNMAPRRRNNNNINKNYVKNPYNNENLYGDNEPLYFTFRPKNKPTFEPNQNPGPRRIPYDKFSNMNMGNNRPSPPNRRNGPPPPPQAQQQMFGRNPPRNNTFPPGQFNNNYPIVAHRVQGQVKWYNFKKQFGFITRFDTNEDIFVHQSGIRNTPQYNGMLPSLDDAEHVEFDVCQDSGRLIAVNVTGPSGDLVKGSKYANMRSPIQTKVYRRSRNTNVAN